jgi:hypothetical protein
MKRNRPGTITFRQLRDELNLLTEEQLDMPARWMGDERTGTIKSVETFEEDMLVDEEYAIERSAYSEEEAAEMELAYPAGTPYLEVDHYIEYPSEEI